MLSNARKTIPIIGASNKDRAIAVNNQLTSNLVSAQKSYGAKSQVILESGPGRVQRGIAGNGACRTAKMLPWKGKLYGVFGTKLVSIDANLVAIDIGTLNTASGTVVIARGRNYLMLVDGTNGYTWDNTTFAAISDMDFPGVSEGAAPTHCVYLDGAFVVNDPSNDNFFRSGTEDPTSWNALDFEAASVAPDNVLGIAATESILYMVGEVTTQPYYNSGNADFPYAVYLSGVQEIGLYAIYSLARSDDGVFFLATTPEGGIFAYRMMGTEGQKISGDEQDGQFLDLVDATTAVGFIYTQSGKSFYVLQFPDDDLTLTFNISAGVWEDRSTNNGRWDVGGHGVISNKNIVGSINDSRFYELSLSSYADGDFPLIRKRRTQLIHVDNYLVDYHELIIDFQPGVGTASGQGKNPVCFMRYSNDAGHTWSSVLQAPIGRQGESQRRARFTQLGSGRNRIFEFWVSDPVQVVIIAGYASLTVLRD